MDMAKDESGNYKVDEVKKRMPVEHHGGFYQPG